MLRNFFKLFPRFQSDGNFTFCGNLLIKGQVYRIKLFLPNFPLIKDFTYEIFMKYQKMVLNEDKLASDLDIVYVLRNIEEYLVLEETCEVVPKLDSKLSVLKLKNRLNEIKMLSNLPCQSFMSSCSKKFKFTDFEKFRSHYIEVEYSNETQEFKITKHSLPDCLDSNFEPLRPNKSLLVCVEGYYKSLESFDEFYGDLNCLDQLCHVVEPLKITTKDNFRIIKLTEKVLIKIALNPVTPSSVNVNIFGPTEEVQVYRQLYNDRARDWDLEIDAYQNLLRIFNLMCFPIRQSSSSQEKVCDICYKYEIDDHVPIISCDSSKCDVIFHVICLKEWFLRQEQTTYLLVTIGICPYCKNKLSASFNQLLEM